ncbi:MAG: hypothetical protein OXI67_04935 [Candidatus Poribacteria bacterium]|nr:hypothetical protein [Candidatus Poribacteria bacterium]MDE0481905.1 hypothetical protein [Candidatus Poribacteria bacterium]
MYLKFEIELKFRDKIYGGLPKDKDVLKNYVKNKFSSEDTSPTADDLDLTEEIEKRTVGFKRDDRGIYIGSYQIKAMLAQAASLLELTITKRGSKQTMREGLIIKGQDEDDTFTGEKIYLLPRIMEPTGIESHAGNVSTPQGSRSILKTLEYVLEPTVKFQLWLLKNRIGEDNRSKKLVIKDIKKCFLYGMELGLGSHRKYEAGKFDVVRFEELPYEESEEINFEIPLPKTE